MIRAGIAGATGYAGAELVRWLSRHHQVKLTLLTSRQYAGVAFAKIFPSFRGVIDQICEPYDAARMIQETDVVFLALPHQLPMRMVPDLLAAHRKVIDLSADFRLTDARVYEAHYQAHEAPELLERAVYGLSEVHTTAIAQAQLVANPGCYPTSALLPLIPLLQARLIEASQIIVDAKSGVSGAGRSPVLTTHFCEVAESFKAYKVAQHRHNPEMDEKLSLAAGQAVHVTFVPHLVPMSRGMLTTIYARLANGIEAADIAAEFRRYYEGRPFVRLRGESELPDTRHVRNTNFCDIGWRIDTAARNLILISAIDNLVKGAAGQAVQNMNIMFGLAEDTGLAGMPYPL